MDARPQTTFTIGPYSGKTLVRHKIRWQFKVTNHMTYISIKECDGSICVIGHFALVNELLQNFIHHLPEFKFNFKKRRFEAA